MSKNKYLLILVLTGLISFSTATIIYVNPGSGHPIQAAINAASSGDTIQVAAGTYPENDTINKYLTLRGAGPTTIIRPTSGYGIEIKKEGNGLSATARTVVKDLRVTHVSNAVQFHQYTVTFHDTIRHVTLQNLQCDSNTGNGVYFGDYAYYRDIVIDHMTATDNTGCGISNGGKAFIDGLTITGGFFARNVGPGLSLYFNADAGGGADNIIIDGATFDSNAYRYHQNADIMISNVNDKISILNTTINSNRTESGIRITGGDTCLYYFWSADTITLSNVTINGTHESLGTGPTYYYPSAAINLTRYSDVSNVHFTNVNLNSTALTGTGLFLGTIYSSTTPPTLDLTGITFNGTYRELIKLGRHGNRLEYPKSNVSVDARNATFTGLTNNFTIEDKITHKLDENTLGLVTWVANNVYVTPASGSIQRGINAISSGGTVNVAAGTYTESPNFNDKAITLAPGASPAQVILNNLTLQSDDTLKMELNGTTAGTGYDQLVVSGTVILGVATLNLSRGFTPEEGTVFTIIDNDDVDAVNGTFAGLSEGSVITLNDVHFTISYLGGDGDDDGNDVTLTVTTVAAGWVQKESLPTGVAGKYVKDGGALVTVGSNLYAFRGNKSKEFYMYKVTQNTWIAKESIPYGFKLGDPTLTKIYKKKPGKGASLCWNGDSFIYATKGNNTREFWRYNINRDTWIQKAFVPSNKALKGGTSIVFKNDSVYLLAGGQKPDSNNFFVYNPAADTQRLNPINPKSPWAVLEKAPRSNDGKVYKDGSCLTVLTHNIYALKGSGKNNYFFRYNLFPPPSGWTMCESMPLTYVSDSSYWPLKQKKDKVRDGAAMTNIGEIIYAIKGGGRQDFMYYNAVTDTWRCLDTIPKGARRNRGVPKTGAALAYIEPYVYLLKGNKTPEFWRYHAPITLFDVRPIANNVVSSVQTLDTHSSLLNAIIDITPNPFTKFATIRYTVPVSGKVSVKLYNATGRLIETLVNKYQNAGSYTLIIDNCKLKIPNGIYFLKYESTTDKAEVKLIVQ